MNEGDIVLFRRDRRLFAHRAIGSKPSQVMTRGDAMPRPDAPVSEKDLLGRVPFLVRRGKRIEPAKTLCFPQRAAAALFRGSNIAARVVVGVHGRISNS